MALGNRNSKNGNKTSSFNYELAVLKALKLIADGQGDISVDLGDVVLNTDDLESLLQGKLGSTEVPSITIATADGSIPAGAAAVSVTNTGTANASFLGAVIKPGLTVEFCTKTGNTFGAMAYDTFVAGAELTILTTVVL